MVLMVLAFFGSGFFTVGPQEKAVILRFGKPVGEGQKALLRPGLHWSFPYPIDEVVQNSDHGNPEGHLHHRLVSDHAGTGIERRGAARRARR